MDILSNLLVALGTLLLLLSIKPAIAICKQDEDLGWKFLLLLIILFFFAYLFFLYYLLTTKNISTVEQSLSMILFAGSIFVTMVINLSLKSFNNIKQIADKERYNSLHDSLTGLPNRKYFLNTVVKKIEKAKPFSVLVLDINSFNSINDMIGHYFADHLLIKITRAIKQQLSTDCFFSRIAGDEFTILSNAIKKEDINHLNLKIHRALNKPFYINGDHIKVNITVGVSIFPDHGTKIISLLQKAELSMYAAKKKQLAYLLYEPSLDKDDKFRFKIFSKLHIALEQDEFIVHYQPLINVIRSKAVHFEALIRWPQARGSFIPPDKFIPVAEQSGLIRDITFFVLNTIVEDLQEFKDAGIEACVHLNLSARDLQNEKFASYLVSLINKKLISPEQLILEVTETAILTDLVVTKEILIQLSRQGFLISLDDFGTGYSSMSILRDFPINQIKIDRTFVKKMVKGNANHSIVHSIIFLAHELNCTVVAEGVETKELVDQLIDLECDYLQGYYYSKPLPILELIEFCKQSPNAPFENVLLSNYLVLNDNKI